jgi:hypothetical protein
LCEGTTEREGSGRTESKKRLDGVKGGAGPSCVNVYELVRIADFSNPEVLEAPNDASKSTDLHSSCVMIFFDESEKLSLRSLSDETKSREQVIDAVL